jgi:hypothetical protein
VNSIAPPHTRIPFAWLVLACAVAIGSWFVTQRLLPAGTSHISDSGVLPSNPLPRITEERAIALAINDFESSPGGITLQHPRHQAAFTDQGVTFTPQGGGPEWGWHLSQVRLGTEVLEGVELAEVLPTMAAEGLVRYGRGPLIEQYLAQANSLEQQFVLPERLSNAGGDLVIIGQLTSAGEFATTDNGWRWSDAMGEVHLGKVYVFDASGSALPATMRVTATQTEIRIPGAALAEATYPVTIDPEIGANDFRISDIGKTFDAFRPAVAYNPTQDEYLVVWEGDDSRPLEDDEFEIFGQRVAGATGSAIGDPLRLSDMGPDGDPDYDAVRPAVAYNPTQEEYLVVWRGDDDTSPWVDNEYEIYGQRVNGATGAELGGDVRLSSVGPIGNPDYDANRPAVTYNATQGEYLVVFTGPYTLAVPQGETEIWGQRVVGATGNPIGSMERLSDMGPDGDTVFEAIDPAVAYNPTQNEYLVVWQGDDDTGSLVNNENEIYGQRVDGSTGVEISSDIRLSAMGPDGDQNYDAFNPAVTYNPTQDEYLVVWWGDDPTGLLVQNEFEIFGQRVAGATGAELDDDFRLSDMGPDGDTLYQAWNPAVSYNPAQEEYLVVWEGTDNTGALVVGESEIFGQRVDGATGAELGDMVRLSDMGPDGDTDYSAFNPAVAHNPTEGAYLVVWEGDNNIESQVDDEFEIYGQLVEADTGAEIGEDIRLRPLGAGGNPDFDAVNPATAYNPTQDEYLVVWHGDDNPGSLVDEEFEIFGQRVDGATGATIGDLLRLSDMGPDGDPDYAARNPGVAYNSTQDEYLVVWEGDDDTGSLVNNEFEIFGQRVAGLGFELDGDFRLSDMGANGGTLDGAFNPAVAYNPTQDEYLVVWQGDDYTDTIFEIEYEIYGQLVASNGIQINGDFRLSDTGPNGDPDYDAYDPAVAYNSTEGEYLVVWSGDDNTGSLVDEEFEIFGQRVDAASGDEIGGDLPLSDIGPDGDPDYDAFNPALAYNPTQNEYLVIWEGDDTTIVDDEFEIFGLRLAGATGAEIGDPVRLSDMGPEGDSDSDALNPTVVYNPTQNEYLVIWEGDDNTGSLVDDEFEIYGQRVAGDTGAEIGEDVRLSDMGPDGDPVYAAFDPAGAYNLTQNEYLVVWSGDDNTGSLVDNDFEIFGQRFASSFKLYLPLIQRD